MKGWSVRVRPRARVDLVLAGAGLFAAHDLALGVHARGDGLVGDVTANVPRALEPRGEARLAVEAGRDAVGERVVAGLDGRELPLEGLGLARPSAGRASTCSSRRRCRPWAPGRGSRSRGSSRPGASRRDFWPNAVTPSPGLAPLVSTVTATFGTVRCSGLRTRMRIVSRSAIDCLAGNDASATSSRKVPSGSFGVLGLAAAAGRRPRAQRSAAGWTEGPTRRARTYHRPKRAAPVELAARSQRMFRFDAALLRGITFTPS